VVGGHPDRLRTLLDILYDHRDPLNSLTIALSDTVPMFQGRVEKDRPTVAQRSAKVVALSTLYEATKMLVGPLKEDADEEQVAVGWRSRVAHLSEIDWRKTDADWQGICMLGGDIITRRQTREATSKYIQRKLGILDEKPEQVLGVVELVEAN